MLVIKGISQFFFLTVCWHFISFLICQCQNDSLFIPAHFLILIVLIYLIFSPLACLLTLSVFSPFHPPPPSPFLSILLISSFLPYLLCLRGPLSLSSSLIKAGNKPPPATPGKPKKATTFQEFESITSDAWDVGDDDDELLAMAAQNLNIEVVMETANKVSTRTGSRKNPLCLFKGIVQHFDKLAQVVGPLS